MRPPSSPRGAAMLLAIVAIAILSALTADLAYETQVRLRIATNARDELRAEALAQSAVTVSRLVLGFQYQLDQVMGAGQTAGPQATPSAGGQAPAAPSLASALPHPQIWRIVPVSSALTQALFGGPAGEQTAPPGAPGKGAGPRGDQPALAAASYGDFEGGFSARIEDEAQKVNVQLDSFATSGILSAQVDAFLRMVCDSRWDPLFDRSDADGQRYSRSDVLSRMKDWVDPRPSVASSSAVSFPGGNCSPLVPSNPFEDGFSDKNYPYDRGPDRYRTKNARMDSLDELFLVAGVSDAFMAAFQDQLTVYLPINGTMNVNADDLRTQVRIALQWVDPVSYLQLADPTVQQKLHERLALYSSNGALGITFATFQQALQDLNLKLRSDLALQQKAFTDRSLVFQVRALGAAGDVTHETLAVVSFDPKHAAPADRPVQTLAGTGTLNLGQLIHWREE